MKSWLFSLPLQVNINKQLQHKVKYMEEQYNDKEEEWEEWEEKNEVQQERDDANNKQNLPIRNRTIIVFRAV